MRASVIRVGNASSPPAARGGKSKVAEGGLGWDSVEVRMGCRVLPSPDTTELELVYRVTPSADLIVSATLSPPQPPPSSSSSDTAAAGSSSGGIDASAANAAAGFVFECALQPGKTIALQNNSTATHLDVEGSEVTKS